MNTFKKRLCTSSKLLMLLVAIVPFGTLKAAISTNSEFNAYSLYNAVRRGKLDLVKEVHLSGVYDLNMQFYLVPRYSYKADLIHLALFREHLDVVTYLIRKM